MVVFTGMFEMDKINSCQYPQSNRKKRGERRYMYIVIL
jgi:hypothetical protein